MPDAAPLLDQRSLNTDPLAEVEAWTRMLDPVVVTGSQLPLFNGVTLGDLFVYKYNGSTWTVVPFQFDEVDSGGTFVPAEDGLLDSNDKLVFMASDLGNKATPGDWLSDASSRSYSRYEVRVTNPLNAAEEGWVYVYRSATLAPTFSPYVTWDNTNHRTVAVTYIIGYDPSIHLGMDSLELNGTGVDVLDRSKLRLSGRCYSEGEWHNFSLNEEDETLTSQFEPPDIQGPVRQGGGTLDHQSWSYASLFENNTQFDASSGDQQCEDIQYTAFRLSEDWRNPSESGMAPLTYYDSNTPGGVLVDGAYDSIPTTPVTQWWEISGARGSVVQVAAIASQGATVTNYYWDVQDPDPEDTGDQRSFGDAGYKLSYPDAVITLSFANYVLGANQGNVGGTYRQYHANPLQTTATAHGYLVAPTLNPIDNADGNGDYLVDWSDVSSATGYELQEDDNSAFSTPTVRYSGANSQYQVTGQAGGTWYYRVRASNAGGNGPWSSTRSVGVLPAAPVLAPISNPDGDGAYLVDWSDVTGATSYQLQEDDNPAFSTPTVRYTGASSQYQVTAQTAGTWYYRVRASNATGDGSWSNTQSVSVVPAPPVLAPIPNSDGNGDYLVDWSDVTGATGYELQEDDNSDFSTPTVRYSGTSSQYQVTGQTGGIWYYRVRASNAGGNGPWSNTELAGVIPAAPVLSPINNPDGNGDYLVDWSDVAGATNYRLEEDDDPGFGSPTVRYNGTGSQYQVTGQAGGTWYYRVRAGNASGNSPWSNTQSVGVVLGALVLSPISNPDGDGEYLVDWNEVAGVTGYELQEDDNSEFTSSVVRYTGTNSQYQVSGQGPGLWFYRVRASNAGGYSPWSNVESAGVVPEAPALAPIDNSDGDSEYLVHWSSVTGATSYTLEEDDDPAFSTPTTRYSGSNSQYQVSGQGAGMYYYRVRAVGAGGNSAWSNTESVGVASDAPLLAAISNADGDGNYLVDWSDVAGATSYELQEDDNGSFTSAIVRYTGTGSQYQVYGQAPGLWYYRVRAVNAGGNGPWSNIQSVGVVPAAPALDFIQNPDGDGDYLVVWPEVPGATSYELQEDDNAGFSSPIVRYTGPDTQYQAYGQGPGLWFYRVRASNAGGSSPWSNIQPVGVVPAAPVLAAISNPEGGGAYLVDWSDVTGATSYELQEDDNAGFSSPTVRYSGASSQYQIMGQAGGDWYYRVRAVGAGGNSAWSNSQSVTVSSSPLEEPVLLPIDNADGNGDYLVDWSDVDEAVDYTLEEDDDPYFESPMVRYAGASSEYPVTSHEAGTWYYRVRASNAAGDSPWSNSEPVSVIPGAPELLPIGSPDEDGEYLVDWSAVAGATNYRLEEADNSAFNSATVRYNGANSQYQITGQAGGTWYYRVRAENAGGNSPWSSTRSVSVVPAVPVLASINNSGGSDFMVDWNDVAGATRYRLEEDDNPSFASPTVRYAGASSQYQVYGQATGLWYYRVRASNAGGDSPWSNAESVGVIPDAPALAPVDNLDGDGEYLVDWNDVIGATSYELVEDDNAGFTSPTVRYTGASSQYQVSGQETGLWYYWVRASNAGGNSSWSNIGSAGVIPVVAVLAPISNPDKNGLYLVDWGDVTGATSYELQEDDNSGFASPTVRYTGAGSQYQVYGQGTGLWYYRVRASNAGGDSDWSNIESASVIPDAPALAPVDNLDGDGEYLVDWNDVTGATSYQLEEDDNSTFISPTVRYTGAGSQYQVSVQGTGLWYYRVRASNAAGDSPWSGTELVGVIPDAPALAPIDNNDGDGEYLVDWSDVTGATSYQLEEDDSSEFSSPTVRYTGGDSQYQVSAQATGLWYYRVRASNAGGSSLWSNTEPVSVVPAAPVLAPINNPDGNGYYLVDWSDVTGATGYRLEEDDNPAFISPTVRYSGANSQYQVILQEGGQWYYRVRAASTGGDGPWSNTEAVAVAPEAPTLAPIDNPESDGEYLVDWSDPTGATSYQLEEDDSPAFDSPSIRYTGAGNQYQVSGQETGLWYYRVRASNAGGDSPWSNTELARVVPAAPVLDPISNVGGNKDYLLDWSNVTGATGYQLEEDDDPTFTSPVVRYSGANTQYQVYGQETGLWHYRVRAVNAGGDGLWSNAEEVGVVPAVPMLSAIDNADGDGEYLVDWDDVAGAVSYQLQEDDNSAFSSPTVRYAGEGSQYQVIAQEGGLWYYRVRAANASGESAWSNTEAVGAAPASPALDPISNPDGDGEYLVDWDDLTGAASYQLEEDDNSAFSSPTVRYAGEDSQYQVSAQETGLWYYRVRASNVYGDGSWSNTETVSVVPAAPELLVISDPDGDRSYVVEWMDVSGATGYKLEEDDNRDFSSPITRYDGPATQIEVAGQPMGSWYYRVRAYNSIGNSPWSATQSVSLGFRVFLPLLLRGSAGGP